MKCTKRFFAALLMFTLILSLVPGFRALAAEQEPEFSGTQIPEITYYFADDFQKFSDKNGSPFFVCIEDASYEYANRKGYEIHYGDSMQQWASFRMMFNRYATERLPENTWLELSPSCIESYGDDLPLQDQDDYTWDTADRGNIDLWYSLEPESGIQALGLSSTAGDRKMEGFQVHLSLQDDQKGTMRLYMSTGKELSLTEEAPPEKPVKVQEAPRFEAKPESKAAEKPLETEASKTAQAPAEKDLPWQDTPSFLELYPSLHHKSEKVSASGSAYYVVSGFKNVREIEEAIDTYLETLQAHGFELSFSEVRCGCFHDYYLTHPDDSIKPFLHEKRRPVILLQGMYDEDGSYLELYIYCSRSLGQIMDFEEDISEPDWESMGSSSHHSEMPTGSRRESKCMSCLGHGGKYVTKHVPNYSGEMKDTSYRVWEPCGACGGDGIIGN